MIILLHFSFLPCLGRAVVRVVPVGLTCPAMTFLLPGADCISFLFTAGRGMGHSYRAGLAGFIFLFVRAGRGTGHPYRIPIRPYLPLCPGRAGAGAILDGLACPAVSFSLFGVAWAWAIPIGLASRPYLPLCPGWARAGAILDRLACPALSFSLFGAAGAWATPIGLAPRPYFPLCPGWVGAGANPEGLACLAVSSFLSGAGSSSLYGASRAGRGGAAVPSSASGAS